MPPRRRRAPQEFIQDITVADDGIRPFRPGHDWSRNKLGILRSYLNAYAIACQRAGAFYFVDPLAGRGLYLIEETSEWLLGSTPIALQTVPAFAKCLSMDSHAGSVEALRRRTADAGERAVVVQGDCNQDLQQALTQHVPRTGPIFALLDPEGTELEWETVRMVAGHRQGPRKTELLILFATEGVNRMLPVEDDMDKTNHERLVRLFPPSADWNGVWQERRAGRLTPAEARAKYVGCYEQGLREMGYVHVLPREVRRGEGSGRLIYHLIFASDHDAGERIMADVFDWMTPNQPQQRLF